MIEEGMVIEVQGQMYLVTFVEYAGSYSKHWVKSLELKGLKDE